MTMWTDKTKENELFKFGLVNTVVVVDFIWIDANVSNVNTNVCIAIVHEWSNMKPCAETLYSETLRWSFKKVFRKSLNQIRENHFFFSFVDEMKNETKSH